MFVQYIMGYWKLF